MTPTPTHADLVARALDALTEADRARVDLALAADPKLRAAYDTVAAHLLRYDHLPPAPEAPPFARLEAALDASLDAGAGHPDRRVLALQSAGRTDGPRALRWALPAVAAAALLAVLLWAPWQGTDEQPATLAFIPGPGLTWTRAGAPRPAPARAELPLAVGDRLSCVEPAEAQLSGRVRVVLDAGSALTIEAARPEDRSDIGRVRLERGRAWFEVGPGPFAVELGEPRGRRVEVLGTAFEIDLRAGQADVAVAHGRVLVRDPTPDARDTLLEAGWGLRGGTRARLQGPAGAWFRRPRLTLVSRTPGFVQRGAPLMLDLRFTNAGQVPLRLQGPGAVRTAIWLSFENRDGHVIAERPVLPALITAGGGLLAPGASEDLQPGQSRVLSIEILPPVGSPGAYRCRALYRPEGQPAVLSAPLDLEVR